MTLVYHLYGRHFVTWSQEQGSISLKGVCLILPVFTSFIPRLPLNIKTIDKAATLLHLQVGCVIHPPMENAYDLDFIVCYLTIKNDMRANILFPITSFNVATVSALGRVFVRES